MEAITSRALLLAAVGKATGHAGKTTLYLTPMHAARATPMLLIANVRAALGHVRTVAGQFPASNRWKTLLDYIVARIIHCGQNHPKSTSKAPPNICPFARVTAVFRLNAYVSRSSS
ncbi:MAG: hypothetical protein ACYDC6_11695 [Acidobacteriaceae bacterium]